MHRIYKLLTHEYFLYAIVLAISIGIYYARAAVSIATVTLGAVAVLTAIQKENWPALKQSKSVWSLTAVFLVILASGIVSDNTAMWIKRLDHNLPFLALPVGIWAFSRVKNRVALNSVLIFVGATVLSSLAIMVDYLLHMEEYNALYKVGKTIPTPIIHVRYSYFLAVACISCIGLLLDKSIVATKDRRWLTMVTIWLALCVHVLAVRTGIFALYGGIMTLAAVLVIRERRWKAGVAAAGSILVVFTLSVLLLPSVGNKIGYVLHDLNMMRVNGFSPEYSDNIRIASIKSGLQLFVENPVMGVGAGDIEDEMNLLYDAQAPELAEENRFPPISQYVYWLATFGLLGTAIIMVLLVYPLVRYWRWSYFLVAVYALTAFSFMAETTIQLQLGKTVFVLLICLGAMEAVRRFPNPAERVE